MSIITIANRQLTNGYPNMSGYARRIRANNDMLDYSLYTSILAATKSKRDRMFELYGYYCSDPDIVPIFRRQSRFSTAPANEQLNTRIHMPILAEVVDISTGYFAGKPFTYGYSNDHEAKQDSGADQSEIERMNNFVSDFAIRSSISDVDMETTRFCVITGACGRLLYHDYNGDAVVTTTPPWDTIPIGADLQRPEYAIYTYTETDGQDTTTYVEFYTPTKVYYYIDANGHFEENKEMTSYTLSIDGDLIANNEHGFNGCPLSYVIRNNQVEGDIAKVVTAANAYDRAVSNRANDYESYSDAYMVFENGQLDPADLPAMQRSGSIILPEGAKVSYLVKQADTAYIAGYIKDLRESIYMSSETPDLSSETALGGNVSGISLKYRMVAFEQKTATFELKFNKSNNYMFELLCDEWTRRGYGNFLPEHCFVTAKRNFPLDTYTEAQTQQMLLGAVSTQTRLEQATFIQNVGEEMERMEQDRLRMGVESLLYDDVSEGASNGGISTNTSGQGAGSNIPSDA